jgi:hypothetical protein
MKISLLVPSRNRSDGMISLTVSVFNLAADKDNVEIIFYIDNDDPVSLQCAKDLKKHRNIKYILGERIILSQMWNECYKVASGEIFHHCGDDVIFRTQNWDELVWNEFQRVPDRIMFLYGRDGLVDSEKLGTHGFLHKNWVDVIGYFMPPYFSWCYNDTWVTEVSTLIGRLKYIPELYIEHMHPAAQKAKLDSTYGEAQQRGVRDNCLGIYNDKADERKADAEKLKTFIENFNG